MHSRGDAYLLILERFSRREKESFARPMSLEPTIVRVRVRDDVLKGSL